MRRKSWKEERQGKEGGRIGDGKRMKGREEKGLERLFGGRGGRE